jgi:hypothetical protein
MILTQIADSNLSKIESLRPLKAPRCPECELRAARIRLRSFEELLYVGHRPKQLQRLFGERQKALPLVEAAGAVVDCLDDQCGDSDGRRPPKTR